ncbi:MAG: right-handed parallel beta-helix repeat-containing protein [Bacteroidales bacterium]|nr:right-handed parallel beta-helix repeat-containing protein [Bacteroidales bacterium]
MLKKGLTVTVVVLFLSISVVPEVVSYTTTNGIIYVDDDGGADYTRIQDAVDNASDGDRIEVRAGTYYENVVVDKSVTIIGEDRETTVIDGGNRGWIDDGYVVKIEADGVSISRFTMRNNSELCYAIICESQYNEISDNIFSELNHIAILCNEDNNEITDNYLYSDLTGIGLYACISVQSNNNIISNKIIVNGGIGIGLDALQNTIENNMVNGKPIVYLEGKNNQEVTDAGQVILVDCDSIVVNAIDISHTWVGVELVGTNNCEISSNTINKCPLGIMLGSSSNNLMSDNIISECNFSHHGAGIANLYSSNNNIISNNTLLENNGNLDIKGSSCITISYNTMISSGEGCMYVTGSNNLNISNNDISNSGNFAIILSSSNENNIINNRIITSNGGPGLSLYNSSSNQIFGNNISLNKYSGIELCKSGTNLISRNTISDNDEGIVITNSESNLILENNFIKNRRNARLSYATENRWRNNYWDRPRFLPKPIFGIGVAFNFTSFPWVNFDWNPAKEPYDIPILEVRT